MPDIRYVFNGKNRRYFPDIYIIPLNLLIEVKCDFTFELDKDKNLAKMEAARRICTIDLMIYYPNGTLQSVTRFDKI